MNAGRRAFRRQVVDDAADLLLYTYPYSTISIVLAVRLYTSAYT